MTFLLRPDVPIENVSRLTILSALATARALADTAGLRAQIKWPNDVVVGGKKICGILTEMSSEGMDIKYAVVGIGINVSMLEFPKELETAVTEANWSPVWQIILKSCMMHLSNVRIFSSCWMNTIPSS